MKLSPLNPALKEKRTIQTGTVKNTPLWPASVLKPANSNTKLSKSGNLVKIGPFKDYYCVSLTLEERKTCPSSCHHWADCYGNGMYRAQRFKHGKELNEKIENELKELCAKYPGVLVRLHILGDFYHTEYISFWANQLAAHLNLAIFGYSARIEGVLHRQLCAVKSVYGNRFSIRFSTDKNSRVLNSYVGHDVEHYARSEDYNGKDCFVCPEQTGKVADCLSCGICFSNSKKAVKFLNH